jgi:hypothetical protein
MVSMVQCMVQFNIRIGMHDFDEPLSTEPRKWRRLRVEDSDESCDETDERTHDSKNLMPAQVAHGVPIQRRKDLASDSTVRRSFLLSAGTPAGHKSPPKAVSPKGLCSSANCLPSLHLHRPYQGRQCIHEDRGAG